MGTRTKIEWATHTLHPERFTAFQSSLIAGTSRLEVFEFVAAMTKRDSVVDVISQFRMFSERFDVVGSEVAASRIAALSAGVLVANKNRISPDSISRVSPTVFVSLGTPVRIGVMVLASRDYARHDLPQVLFFGLCSRVSLPWRRFSEMGKPHLSLCLLGVFMALECGSTSLECLAELFGFRSRPVSTKGANRTESIMPRSVLSELSLLLPLSAPIAKFKASPNVLQVIVNGASCFFCGHLQRTEFGLRH